MLSDSSSPTRLWTLRWSRAALSLSTALAAVLLATSALASERVLLGRFEGPNAKRLRWRVTSAVKGADHRALRYNPPPYGASDGRLSRYAENFRIDAFIFGRIDEEADGSLTLRLTIKGPDASILDDSLVYSAPDFRRLSRLVKQQAQYDLREVLGNPGGAKDGRQGSTRALAETNADSSEDVASDESESPAPPAGNTAFSVDQGKLVNVPAPQSAPSDRAAADDEPPRTKPKKKKKKSRLEALFGVKAKKKTKPRVARSEAEEAIPDLVDEEPSESDESDFAASDPLLGLEGDEVAADVPNDEADGTSPLLRVGLSGGLVSRELTYVDNLYRRLRDQSTSTWVYGVDAELFPFASPLRDRVSLIAHLQSNVAGTVNDAATGEDYNVKYSEFQVGLRLAQPVGAHSLRAQVTLGRQAAGIDDPNDALNVPEFGYTLVRAQLAGLLQLGRLSVVAHGGYNKPLEFGEAGEESWFPRIEGSGFSAGAALAYPLTRAWSLQAGADFSQMNLTMNALPQDALLGTAEVAGGATDRFVTATAGLSYSL